MPGQCPGPARGLQYAPRIVESRGLSVGSVPLAGNCYMVTVIFVVRLGIVFTVLQRINNCHKKTSSPCALFEQDSEEACVYVRELCMHISACYVSCTLL